MKYIWRPLFKKKKKTVPQEIGVSSELLVYIIKHLLEIKEGKTNETVWSEVLD